MLTNPLIVAMAMLTIMLTSVEILLLEGKYNFFTGGFLQSHQLNGTGEIADFLLISLWFDFVFLYAIASVWKWIGTKLRMNALIASYHFLFLTGFLCIATVVFRYELLNYFSDIINYQIIKNLGGGSFKGALVYVSEEMTLALILFSIFITIYLSGHFVIHRISKGLTLDSLKFVTIFPMKKKSYARTITPLFFILTILMAFFVGKDYNLRYGLNKKISFNVINSLFSKLTDFDGDGYSYFSFPVDPGPFDRRIYPGALDIPDNGIDEDGFMGDFHYSRRQNDSENPVILDDLKHIFLIVLESARGELIGKEIDGRLVAPNLTDLSKRGTHFKYAYSHNGYTVPALKAIFSGNLPIGKSGESIFEKLSRLGYEISIFSGQDESFGGIDKDTKMREYANYFFDARTAVNERVSPSTDPGSLMIDEKTLLREIKRRFSTADWRKPQFVYINFQSSHFPYYHQRVPKILIDHPIPRSKIKAKNRQWVERTYWNALAYTDMMLGEVISELKSRGVFDKSIIVVVGDHGESLFDDGFLGHGHRLNEIQTRIPLVFSVPGIKAEEPIGQAEISGLIFNSLSKQKDKKQAGDQEPKAVFQFLGDINAPVQIGMVEINEKRTVLDMRTRKCFFSDLGIWIDYERLQENENLFDRVRRLILEWERLRWEGYISRK